MCTYVIESHMHENHPNSEKLVFVLPAAERAAKIAQCEPKTKKGDASYPHSRRHNPYLLHWPLQWLLEVHPLVGASSNNSSNNSSSSSSSSNTSSPSGLEYCPSESASDAGPQVVTIRSKQPLPKALFRNTLAPKQQKIATKARRTPTCPDSSDSE